MWSFSIGAIVLAAIVLILWRKWGAPWRQLLHLVEQIGAGKQPRTFLIGDGGPVRQTGLALETIFRRQQELDRQLADRTVRTDTIFTAMHDGLVVLDTNRRVTVVNQTARKLFGLHDDAIGAPLLEAIRQPAIDRAISDALRLNQPAMLELSVADRQMQLAAVPMRDEHGTVTGLVVLLHDITDLKRADQMRSDFVANVSHELRTPLSILRGYIETLRDDPELSREETSRILEVMERHSKRLGLLVNDLLTLAQLESHSAQLRLTDISPDALFAEIGRDWEKRFSAKELSVSYSVASDLSTIRADEARLREIFDNLLDNAVKYSNMTGTLCLKAEQNNGAAVLSVSDNGVGMNKEDLPRIFERFYRADKARSRELGGTGLGLSIVKHIAQLHGGRVEAESDPGVGTTIRVILPKR